MAAFDYSEFQSDAKELIEEFGRTVTLNQFDAAVADTNKPWRGGAPRAAPDDTVTVTGVFVDTITSRSLGIFIDRDGNETGESRVLIVATNSAPGKNLRLFNELLDTDGELYAITTLNVLQPGPAEILVAFKVNKRRARS